MLRGIMMVLRITLHIVAIAMATAAAVAAQAAEPNTEHITVFQLGAPDGLAAEFGGAGAWTDGPRQACTAWRSLGRAKNFLCGRRGEIESR